MRFVDHDVPIGAHLVELFVLRPESKVCSCLVEQRRIAERPNVLAGVLTRGQRERLKFVGSKHAPARRLKKARAAKQIVQKLRRRQHRPHPLERFADGHGPADTVPELAGVDIFPAAVGQCGENFVLDVLASCIVGSVAALGLCDDHLALKDRQTQVLEAIANDKIRAELALALTNGPTDHVDHSKVAFHRGGSLGVEPVGSHLRHDEVGQHGEADAGLTERR